MLDPRSLPELSADELVALRGAAVWYAKYQALVISDHAGDRGAHAVAEREEYLDLVSALAKLGVKIRVPDAIVETTARAA
ncbi:MAG: hypothetical protein WD649_05625 [Thermoleophilaceae bacterium]